MHSSNFPKKIFENSPENSVHEADPKSVSPNQNPDYAHDTNYSLKVGREWSAGMFPSRN